VKKADIQQHAVLDVSEAKTYSWNRIHDMQTLQKMKYCITPNCLIITLLIQNLFVAMKLYEG